MSELKSYIVRVWRNRDCGDATVIGIVEEPDEGRNRACETVEEFMEVLWDRRSERLPRKQGFAGFDELRRILESS